MAENQVPLTLYSDALDEIYALRLLLASEARIAEANGDYKTFPKSRRGELENSIQAMRDAARGNVRAVVADPRYRHARNELRATTGSETLTRHAWEAERGRA